MFFDDAEDAKWMQQSSAMSCDENNSDANESEINSDENESEINIDENSSDANGSEINSQLLGAHFEFATADTIDLNEIVNSYIESNTFTDLDQQETLVKSKKSLKNATNEAADSWSLFEIHPEIIQALDALNFISPTPIQQQTLIHAFRRRDIVGCAETGSGKTLAFGIPILDYIAKSDAIDITALILTPTRELAIQVVQHLKNASQFVTLKGCTSIAGKERTVNERVNLSHKIVPLVGGISLDKQNRQVSKNPFVIVATPGRLFSIIQENSEFAKRLAKIKFLVIDEADRMLEQGHFEDLDKILGRLAPPKSFKRQTFVYSATMLEEAINRNLLKRKRSNNVLKTVLSRVEFYDKEPVYINLSNEKVTAAGIFEAKIDCLLEEKDIYLYHLLILYKCKAIVFANSIDAIRRLTSVLKTLQVNCFCLHAEMQQKQRLKNLERFTASGHSCLIASDVASRGLDIPKVDLIVHYQLPRSADIYVHRAGRTGRAQQKGTSIMLCSPEEKSLYKKVMYMLKNEDGLNDFSLDTTVFAQLRKRVKMAREIEKDEHKIIKKSAERNWLKKAAQDLDVDYSESEPEDHSKTLSKNMKLKQQLMELLKKPIVPRHINMKDITRDANTLETLFSDHSIIVAKPSLPYE